MPAMSATTVLSLPAGRPMSRAFTHCPRASRTSSTGACDCSRRCDTRGPRLRPPLLRDRDVDARVARIDPSAQDEQCPRLPRLIVEAEDQIMRLGEPLIAGRREIRHVAVIVRAQLIEHVDG